jgi:hypothetical protein
VLGSESTRPRQSDQVHGHVPADSGDEGFKRDAEGWTPVDDEAAATRVWELACAILRYLETYPEAKDTLEGIAQWWLWRELPEQLVGEVEQAVSLLVSRGLLLETRRGGIPPYYGLNPQRRQVIARLLSGLEGRSMRE